MNRVKLLSVAAFAFMTLILAGCNDGGDPVKPSDGQGNQPLNAEWKMLNDGSSDLSLAWTSWRLKWVVDVERGDPNPDHPNYEWPNQYAYPTSEKSYTLEFRADGTLHSFNSVNEFWGTYTLVSRGDEKRYNINIPEWPGTKMCEYGEWDELWRGVFRIVESIRFNEYSLTLFYTDVNNPLGVAQMGLIFGRI